MNGELGRGPVRFLSDVVSFRVKMMGIVLMSVFLLGIWTTVADRIATGQLLSRQLEEHGIAVAEDMAARSADLILTGRLYSVYELAEHTIANNRNVRYIMILDPGGKVLAHTF
ncbi:hypothetical protein SY88_05770 [Clostridiales bacterium PH28_bin88]|nr:hypothetical protein SY88_05770 [Clostridiales bacterium PH28_bin88]